MESKVVPNTKVNIKNNSKSTLKKRISKAISRAISISSFLLTIMFILFMSIFLDTASKIVTHLVSSDIANEMNSPYFLKEMNIQNLKDFDGKSKEAVEWLNYVDGKIRLDKGDLAVFKIINDHLPMTNAPYFMVVDITVNKTVIHLNKSDISSEKSIEDSYNKISNKGTKSSKFTDKVYTWMYNFSLKVSTSEIKDANNNVIGEVTARLPRQFVLLGMLSYIVLILFFRFISTFISRFISHFFIYPIISPIKQLQDKVDAIANERLEDAVNTKIILNRPPSEIASLAGSTNVILMKIKEYSSKVEEQKNRLENQFDELDAMASNLREANSDLVKKNNQIENLLNNAGQGFLSFGSNLLIYDGHSLECEVIFSKDIRGHKFSSLLYDNDKEQQEFLDDLFKKILLCRNELEQQIYMPLLPNEVSIADCSISIEYKVVKEIDSGAGKSIMVILTDISDKKLLEDKVQQERNILRMVVNTVVNSIDFLECVEEYTDFCNHGIHNIVTSNNNLRDSIFEVFRAVHTFKGSFSQFETFHIVNKLHDLESNLGKMIEDMGDITKLSFIKLISGLNMTAWIDEDLGILKKFLGEDFFKRGDSIIVDKERILEIENKIINTLSPAECSVILPDIKGLTYRSFKDIIKNYPAYVEKIAKRSEKLINSFSIEGDDILVDTEYYRDFTKSLVHVFRNCVDHGIEKPEDRLLQGKEELGTIQCAVMRLEDRIELTISDDGTGIDTAIIKQKAIDHGLCSSDELVNMSNSDVLKLIFEDGFSTSDEVTELSGRGVGLSAVKKALEEIGGNININTEPNIGTEFIFSIPISHDISMPKIAVNRIINSVTETVRNFIREETGVVFSESNYIARKEELPLNNITAFINIRGILDGIMFFSFNESLAQKLTEGFVIDKICEADLLRYIEDTVAECSNIMLGNSIREFGGLEDFITIGTPTIICHKGASIKYWDWPIWNSSLEFEQYSINISFVCLNNFLEEDEI
ncbi:MAG: ATP-binding protein [Bacillota bacterium]|nr:ATP-binding protein [Bacillota bacterium]